MKTNKIFYYFSITLLAVSILTSCDSKNETVEVPTISTGAYVLNQGSYKSNNASMTYYDLATSTSTQDIFTAKNNRGLGDTGQDIIKYGSKLYIAVYKSSLVEVVDAKTSTSLKSIPMLTGTTPSSPRSLAASNGKVYVTLYDGHVAQIDTITYAIEKTIAIGSNPEGCAVVNNKLYVVNSGGMALKSDSTISVINLSTFTEELPRIKVVINPVVLKADSYGDIYVISMGNYYNIPYTFQRINTSTKVVTAIPEVKAYNMAIDGDNAYIYYYNYDANYNIIDKTYTIYDVKNEKILKSNFIATDALANVPYSIDVNPATKDVYIGETDYSNTGKMHCFGSDGTLKFTFPTGSNPVKTIFITNK